ncbi:Mll3428 protein [Candidatus Phaeomarinobacter ectocarpi]|uniref:Mll3428 protein n=1 Tax=Candidatus Phaeomarinibacter ectocarpi TaxID=1458461 RepID=X5MDT8_9HYPH|nr:MmcQ/YjbR family DNA-binding protein [Candidatus Phaeomarinobacter ectocarpi]CDO60472.1 Mll3428 protein [Candidatus Phaeomarinobacter ectocarpi]
MTGKEFNAYCKSLKATTHVVQWGNAHVWKVGGKVFAIGRWEDKEPAFTFKVTDIGFEVLPQQPGVRPAPYMASRGLKWVQHYESPGLSDNELKDYIKQSYDMIVAALSKKKQKELGLLP